MEDSMVVDRKFWTVIVPMHGAALAHAVKAADDMRLEGIWAPSLYGPPFIPLAAAAMASERLKLGTGVALAFTRSPLETALSAIDIDVISGGRAVLGLGPSLRWFNEDWHGVTYGKPLAHLREVVRMVRAIIAGAHSGELGKLEGEYHKLDLRQFKTLAPPPRPRIPIYLPAVFESAVGLAGEIADGLAGHPIWSARWLNREVKAALDAALARAGRTRSEFDLNVWAFVAIDEDRKRAIDDARPTVAFYAKYAQYEKFFAAHGFGAEARAASVAFKRNDDDALIRVIPDEMVTTFALAGTPDDVGERIRELWLSADSLTLSPPIYSMDPLRLEAYQHAIGETLWKRGRSTPDR
jgi:probable F420-dependent oxidoreductase